LTLSNFRDVGGGFELRNQIRHCKTVCIKRNLYLINYNPMRTHWTKKEIETPVLLACAIEDSTDIFGISGAGGLNTPKPPLGTPLAPWLLNNPANDLNPIDHPYIINDTCLPIGPLNNLNLFDNYTSKAFTRVIWHPEYIRMRLLSVFVERRF